MINTKRKIELSHTQSGGGGLHNDLMRNCDFVIMRENVRPDDGGMIASRIMNKNATCFEKSNCLEISLWSNASYDQVQTLSIVDFNYQQIDRISEIR